jgi:hypothetical protein
MPNRLVYSPKVYAYTKNAQNVTLDISPFIVSGEIERNIGQVSTATLVLRNPDKIFTTPSNGIAFHPQDPITIYMERIAGFPVRVFTGYLDQTPYLQLQPAVIQLQASCTLKRLLYSYFDPSLPFMISFFEKYGWINTGQGSIISASGINAKNLKQNKAKLEDGSISRLLWGLLYDVGQWDDGDIWIEPLPQGANGIVNRVLTLMNAMDTLDAAAATELQQVFTMMLGANGQGSGNGAMNPSLTGNTNAQKIFNGLTSLGLTEIAASGMMGNFLVEDSTLSPTTVQIGDTTAQLGQKGVGYGIAQFTNSYANGVGLYADLIQWCKNHGQDPTTLNGQILYIYNHMSSALIAELNSAGTPSQAAFTFLIGFEDGQAKNSPSTQAALNLKGRQQHAEQVYKQYGQGISSNNKDGSKPGASKSDKTKKFTLSGPLAKYMNSNGLGNVNALGDTITSTYDVIVQAANAIANEKYPYIWGGGHTKVGVPSIGTSGENGGTPGKGYDCSGSVAAVLYAAGLYDGLLPAGSVPNDSRLVHALIEKGILVPNVDNSSQSITIWDNPGEHIFMRIGGTKGYYWGTADGSAPGNGPRWLSKGDSNPLYARSDQGYKPYHIPASFLTPNAQYRLDIAAGSTTINDASGGGSDGGGNSGNTISQTSAEAFTQSLDFPSIQDSIVAILLGSEGKGLMHDQSLLPFIQQVCQASMREFMSLPDGSFYAFYPDYFGEMGHHDPYWYVDDIEITSGTINISDDSLATHVYAIGDNTYPINDSMLNELFSAGTITVFNAFQSPGLIENGTDQSGLGEVMGTKDALNFIKRYGARPYVQEYPMVRSGVFEMFMAYQLFMKAWSNQFESHFDFTFMPEIFPGGKIGFPSHGLMMYVNQVTHTFDYTSGFTTTAQLNSPSIMKGFSSSETGLPPNMVAALGEPVQDAGNAQVKPPKTPKKPAQGGGGHHIIRG